MIYEVNEGGETLRVELHEVGEGVYDLTVGGETVRVDAAKPPSFVENSDNKPD